MMRYFLFARYLHMTPEEIDKTANKVIEAMEIILPKWIEKENKPVDK
jgi:hypothetical protein